MDIADFIKNKVMSKCGKFYYAKDGNNLYIKPVNHDNYQFKIPTLLENQKDMIIWRIGPDGRTLLVGNVEVSE